MKLFLMLDTYENEDTHIFESVYATAYIPLSKRGAGPESKVYELTVNCDNVQHNNKSESVYGSSSQSAEIAGKDVDYDLNLTYLHMSFLGISDESLSGVYATNEGFTGHELWRCPLLQYAAYISDEGREGAFRMLLN
nr:polyadenylate-binding protein-interacting protein 5-like [Tanacetum cinerariifolium]